ncbi:hypothetical protein Taro_045714, partial [Colocasia esculenta]|nr:hypothetical protein [Colocasia esculenta]
VGYWRHEPVVRSRMVALFLSDSCFASGRGLCAVTLGLWFYPLSCDKVSPMVKCLVVTLVWLWFPWWYLVVVGTYTLCGYLFLVVHGLPAF